MCASLLPLLYFFLYAPYGFEDKDTGFILGNSWQVLGGSRLYSDIMYIRPPVSVLFHLLSFCGPNDYVLVLDRFLFYLEVWGYSVLAIRLMGQAFQIHQSGHLAFIAALSFVISVHNFPPMAWHTVVLTFWIGYQTPYTLDQHGLHRKEMHYDMGLVYSRLTGIHADRNTYEQYMELKDMVQRYGYSFTVLPSCTLAHFITGTKNPIGSDWVMNAEINGQTDLLIKRLEQHSRAAFVERRKISSEGRWGSAVAAHVVKEWRKVEEGKYFDVYKYIGASD